MVNKGLVLRFVTVLCIYHALWCGRWAGERVAAEVRPYHMPDLILETQPGVTRDPFTRTAVPVFAPRKSAPDPGERCLEIYDDSEGRYPRFIGIRASGKGIRIPDNILSAPGRYFYRTGVISDRGGVAWSDYKWFVVDSRFIGHNALTAHHYPFGKPSAHVMVRDAADRIHVVFSEPWENRRRVYYTYSADDGRTWTPPHRLSLNPNAHANHPILCLSKDGSTVNICWLEWDTRYPPDLIYAAVPAGDPQNPRIEPFCINTYDNQPYAIGSMAADADGNVHIAWHGGQCYGNFRIYYRRLEWQHDTLTVSEISCLSEPGGYGANPIIEAAPDGSVHVCCENGLYRFSMDGGETWIPPLTEAPVAVFEDLCAQDIRPRRVMMLSEGASDRYSLNIVCEGELRQPGSGCHGENEGPVAIHSLWLKRKDQTGEFSKSACIYQIPAPLVTLAMTKRNPDLTWFLRYPGLAADHDGALYVSWEELLSRQGQEGQSRDCVVYTTKVYPDDSVEAPRVLEPDLSTGSFCATMGRQCRVAADGSHTIDFLWTEAESFDWRPSLRGDLSYAAKRIYPLFHGIFFDRVPWDHLAVSTHAPIYSKPIIDWNSMRNQLLRNGSSRMAGFDRWGRSYSFNQTMVDRLSDAADPFAIPRLIHIVNMERVKKRIETALLSLKLNPTADSSRQTFIPDASGRTSGSQRVYNLAQ